MRPRIDLTGQQFGKLTVLEFYDSRGKGSTWKCACACGRTIVARSDNLKAGASTSCGCTKPRQHRSDKDRAVTGGAKNGSARKTSDEIIDAILGRKLPRIIDRARKNWNGADAAITDLMTVYGGCV